VPDTPDPLGKRALFWAPAQRQDAGPVRPGGKRVLPGRHALFSGSDPATAATTTTAKKNGATRTQATRTQSARTQLGAASRPTFADRPATAKKPAKVTKAASAPRVAPPPAVGDTQKAVGEKTGHGPISLSCSKCGTETDVEIVKYLVLHMPYWVWRPGRGYTSLMKCPACGKRTWVSASWASNHR
jgi:hypothetical protein